MCTIIVSLDIIRYIIGSGVEIGILSIGRNIYRVVILFITKGAIILYIIINVIILIIILSYFSLFLALIIIYYS